MTLMSNKAPETRRAAAKYLGGRVLCEPPAVRWQLFRRPKRRYGEVDTLISLTRKRSLFALALCVSHAQRPATRQTCADPRVLFDIPACDLGRTLSDSTLIATDEIV
jgi:hypothetical protein